MNKTEFRRAEPRAESRGSEPTERSPRQPAGRISFDGYGRSEIGGARRINQDQFFTIPLEAGSNGVNCFLGVADGIGGAPGGEDASFIAVETLRRFVAEESGRLLRPDLGDTDILETLTRALRRCHSEIQDVVNHHPDLSGMGTTLTAGLVLWPRLYLVHMGDARAYLLRDGALRLLTHDHTYAQALLEAGVLNERTVKTSAMRNVLSNFLSGDLPEKDPEVHPDVRVELLRPGDTLLFCTDGLTHVVPDEDLARILSSDRSSNELCRILIDRARDLQARDDATVVIARFEGEEPTGGRRRPAEDGA